MDPSQLDKFFAWHWISANGLLIVIGINFAVLACAIGLAIRVLAISRMLNRLTLATERNESHIGRLMKDADSLSLAIASPADDPRAPVVHASAEPESKPDAIGLMASQIREEIESLRAEISTPRDDSS